ncbi:MAG: hypothetical protein AAB436_00305 [Patescibacteria group bacterium]
MDITEQTENRLVLKCRISKASIWSGSFISILGLVLITGTVGVKGDHLIWEVLVPTACILYGLFCIVTVHVSTLSIDKVKDEIARQNTYIFGALSRSKSTQLSKVNKFSVKHIRAFKSAPPTLWLIFEGDDSKITIKSDTLHFADGVRRSNPSDSQEQLIAANVAEFIGLPINNKDGMLDSPKLSKRIYGGIFILVVGLAIGLIGTWTYYRFIAN